MSARRHGVSLATIGVLQLVVAAGVAASYAGLSPESKGRVREVALRRDVAPTVAIPRELPLVVEPLHDAPDVVSDQELAAVLYQLRPTFPAEKRKPNFIEHALRCWSVRAKFEDPAAMSGQEMLDFLVNHGSYRKSWGEEKADGSPLLQSRDHGIAIRTGSDPSESVHHDHWLASLTEAGVRLDEPVFAPGRRNATIEDVLQEALRDFRLDEREVEWSVMAFGLWISPERSWKTTDGREVSFDLLARRLIRGDRKWGVCSGTHRVYSLAVLMRLDDEFHILSADVRKDVEGHLRLIRDLITASQLEDGHWPTNWMDGKGALEKPADDPNYRKVIATGHHLEWLAIVPEEFHVPREQIRRAARWIIDDTVEKSGEEILERYTFYSHVANALSLWRKTHPSDAWNKWEAAHPGSKKPTLPERAPAGPALPQLPAIPAP